MSGQLEVHGIVLDWDNLRFFLQQPHTHSQTQADSEEQDDDWNSDWSWDEEKTLSAIKTTTSKPSADSGESNSDPSWFQKCIVANSPAGDLLVIATGAKAVFLTSEWDLRKNRMQYSKSFEGALSQEEGETITSVVCIPLVSKKRSSPGAPDWSAVVVGFNHGHVRMYTESGSLLLAQQFHNERVQSIKVRSFVPAPAAMQHDQLEELIILYRTVIVTMDGFGLFQTLRACRNHLARIQANATETSMDAPPLSYKKWGFDTEQTISDCELVGLSTPSTFDHLYTGSLLGGFHAKCKANPLTSNIFISTGQKPFIAFHYAQDGHAIPVLTEIAYAVASKFKSSILSAATGLFGFGGNSSSKSSMPKEKPKIEPATSMQCRFGLADARRRGTQIVISPCRKLSVVTDTLGRVTLFDNAKGIAIRIWKGYRDAQCSWIQVDEDVSSKSRVKEGRTATFLIIYAPRRGNLEVFAMQQGPKVATFNVSKSGRLLCTTYGLLGLNNIPIRGGNKPVLQCLFFDSDGQLCTVNIPFHLALCDKTSSKVKDLHLLKSLQKSFKERQFTEETLLDILVEIHTPQMINQAFKMLTQKCDNLEVFTSVIQSYLQRFCDEEGRDLSIVFRLQSLLDLYGYLTQSNSSPPSYSTAVSASSESDDQTILYCLHATDKEIKVLHDVAKEELQTKVSKTKSVTFKQDGDPWSLNEFFACFSIEFDPNKKSSTTLVPNHPIKLNLKSDEAEKLGRLLLCGCLNGTSDLKDWKQSIRSAGLEPAEVLLLTLKFWCQNALLSSSYVGLMEKLYHVLLALCELEGFKAVTNEFSLVSKWWEDIRVELSKSSQIFHIYSFAIVSRAVAIYLQQHSESEMPGQGSDKAGLEDTVAPNAGEASGFSKTVVPEEAEWENMSLDLFKWNMLLKQIEDLHLLSSVLAQRPVLDNAALPVLQTDATFLSVINLLDKGKGCLAELVGKWLTTIGIAPQLITDNTERETRHPTSKEQSTSLQSEAEEAIEAVEMDKSTKYVLELLTCLKENFSVSLSSSIVLANYCWEYCLQWNKGSNGVEYLDAAMKCVNAIPTPHIRQGMMTMMWSTFVSKKLSAIVSRNKMDKFNGFSTPEMNLMFLRVCVAFLDSFMEANVICEGVQPPKNPVIKNHWSSDASASLADLALIQPHSNYEMILLHYQLALCTQFVHSFRIKKTSMRPSNMFDTKARMLFFQSMGNPAPYSNVEVDLALKIAREEMLCLVISNAIRAIPEDLNTSTGKGEDRPEFLNIIPSHDGVRICDQWIQKCFELGRIWGLELDGLRINQVCEYYSSGFDLLGLENIGSVSGRDILGAKLLVIAGMRISFIINLRKENVTEILSSLSTNLSNWLDSLDYTLLRCLRFSKESIVELAQQVIQLIPDSSYDYKLAEELLLSSSFL